MRKYLFVVLFLSLCPQIVACDSKTEKTFAEIESGLEQLEGIETLSYEYITEITNENGTGSIGHVVEMNRNTGDYTYTMFVDEVPISENCYENGMSYRKVNGDWYEAKDLTEPPYPADIIPEKGDIETVKRSESDGTVRIEIYLNDNALRQRESNLREAGEDAVKSLEEWGISDELTEAQQELNELHHNIRFIEEIRHYVIDENGVLIEYREVLDYMDNGTAEHGEMIFCIKQ